MAATDANGDKAAGSVGRSIDANYRYFLDQTMEGFYRLDFEPPIPIDVDLDELVARMYRSGFVADCNQVFAETYGYSSPQETVGARLVDLHGGADVPENIEALRDFVRADFRHIAVETIEKSAGGNWVHLLNNSVGLIEDGLYLCCWGTQRDITDQRRAEKLVNESREQLRALAVGLRRAQEEERIQCARLIHDEMGQLLTGLKMDFRWLEDQLSAPEHSPALNPLLDRVVASADLVDQMTEAVRQIAARMRPGILDQLGLAEALKAVAREFGERFELRVAITVSESMPPVPKDISNELYYICREALTNIARHAGAQTVEIDLRTVSGDVVLDVRDDGTGFNLEVQGSRQSLGVLGMQERALEYGGSVEISGREPRGTSVLARIPLANETQNTKESDARTVG